VNCDRDPALTARHLITAVLSNSLSLRLQSSEIRLEVPYPQAAICQPAGVPHSRANVWNLLCLAHLLIVDFDREHQHFFLVARLTLLPRAARH